MRYKRLQFHDGDVLIVVTFDICSSSDIIEELTTRGDIDRFRRLITDLKRYLAKAQRRILFDPYKFTGDGWILLFPADATRARGLLKFMRDLSAYFQRAYERVERYLDTPPKVTGINFGVDKGPIFQTTMYAAAEYIGRPINVACRLQSAIKEDDEDPAYKALVTKAVFNDYLAPAKGYRVTNVTRRLRNIRGGSRFQCKKIQLLRRVKPNRRRRTP